MSELIFGNTQEEEENVSIFDNEPLDDIINFIQTDITTETTNATQANTYVQGGVMEQIENITANDSVGVGLASGYDDTTSTVMHDQEQERREQVQSNMNAQDLIRSIQSDFNKTNESQRGNETRFSGAEWFERAKQADILLAGVGGIGSWAAMLLSRIQPNSISIFDDDVVEFENLAGQLYMMSNIKQFKASSTAHNLIEFSNYSKTNVFNEKYTGQMRKDIMICGFDNMMARRLYFDNWMMHINTLTKENKEKCLFIDGRLGLEELQIFSIRGDEPKNVERYINEYLFDDSEAEQVPCSMKQTSFMAAMIGSLITNIFINFITNMGEKMDVRSFPFITLYNASDMQMKLIL